MIEEQQEQYDRDTDHEDKAPPAEAPQPVTPDEGDTDQNDSQDTAAEGKTNQPEVSEPNEE